MTEQEEKAKITEIVFNISNRCRALRCGDNGPCEYLGKGVNCREQQMGDVLYDLGCRLTPELATEILSHLYNYVMGRCSALHHVEGDTPRDKARKYGAAIAYEKVRDELQRVASHYGATLIEEKKPDGTPE